MDIRIYQINSDRDTEGYKFMDLAWTKKHIGFQDVDSEIYDKVYEGTVDEHSLEDVFCTFNFEKPDDFTGHSLSVSDVVEVVKSDDVAPGFYFCDTIGFKNINFDTSRVPEKEDTIQVVLLEPGKIARVVEIDSSLRGLQQTVKGLIEAVYPFDEDVCLVCNEEGKINGMPLNRALRYEGEITDIIAGPCFVCACDKAAFTGLTETQQQKYLKLFKYPERFFKVGDEIAAIAYNPQWDKDAR